MNANDKVIKVSDLVDDAYHNRIWLPEFQRPFVWDKHQVRLLIDSIYNDYTISSILVWEGGDELARRSVGASIKDIKVPEGGSQEVVYLLDGQQRTTALTLAFTDKKIYKGTNTKKVTKYDIYWDSEYEGDDPEMMWIFSDDKIKDPHDDEKTIQLRDYSEGGLLAQEFGARFVKIKHARLFDPTTTEAWFTPENKMAWMEFRIAYSDKLRLLEKAVLDKQVSKLEQPGTLEKVLTVFERINTKNTKLSIFDIMVAKTYRKFDEG